MSKCKCRNISYYDKEGHRCIQCFEQFVKKSELDDAMAMIVYIREEIASMIQDEFDNYAPDEPPVERQEFLEALKEAASD